MVILYSTDQVSSSPNSSIAKLYDVHWLGNIVVMKCSKTDPQQIIQMDWGDKHLVDVIVALYVFCHHPLFNASDPEFLRWLKSEIMARRIAYKNMSW